MGSSTKKKLIITSLSILLGMLVTAITYALVWVIPAWEKAACQTQLNFIQNAASSYVGLNKIPPEDYDIITLSDLEKLELIAPNLSCPSGGSYVLEPVNHDMNTPWVRCTCDPSKGHSYP